MSDTQRAPMWKPESLRAILDGRLDAYPTTYRGIPMRSKLEAAFARHLDELGVEWTYEPRRFYGTDSSYLPDFKVGTRYIEVKPTLAEVPGAQDRMSVIWQDEPDAILVVACAQECRFFATDPDGAWHSFVERWKHD